MKEFAIIGLGNFGATVATELTDLHCRVTAIDNDRLRVQSVQDYTHTAIVADATDRSFLENLDVGRFDCVVVSTGEDTHASILITLYLRELKAQSIIVKAKTTDHAKILLKVGATETVIPEKQMASRLSHSLAQSNLVDYLPLTAEYSVAELVPPSKFVSRSLKELDLRTRYHVQLIATKDSHTGEFNFAPAGSYQIKDSDIMVILGKGADIDRLRE